MPFNVRIFGYRGIVQAQAVRLMHANEDSVFFLEEPYLWSQKLSVASDGSTFTPLVTPVDVRTTFIKIEVDDGEFALLEIGALVNGRPITQNSPVISGEDIFEWGPGFTLAVVAAIPGSPILLDLQPGWTQVS